jgi:hypothetical protein
MSNCTLTGEYALFQKTHKFNVEEMLRLIDYGFSGTTAPERLMIDAHRLTRESIPLQLRSCRQPTSVVSEAKSSSRASRSCTTYDPTPSV